MFCNNCGKKLEDGSVYCPICGSKQKRNDYTGFGSGIFTIKQYFCEVDKKRMKRFKRRGAVLSVFFILLSFVLTAFLWLGLAEVSSYYEEYSNHSSAMNSLIREASVSEEEREELLELFDISEDEFEDLAQRYKAGELRTLSDIRGYVTFERTVKLLISDAGLGSISPLLFYVLAIYVALMTLASVVISLLLIIAVSINSRKTAVNALTLSSLLLFPSLFTLIPLFLLSVIVERMIRKNEKIYGKYLESVSKN